MNKAMKTYLIAILIFKLVTSFVTKQNNLCTNGHPEQLTYRYKSEAIGYSNIAFLYSPDSAELKHSFFFRKNLEETQININCEIRKTIYSKEKSGSQVCFEILSPEISIENNELPINTDVIIREMQYPILATINNQGRFSMIRIDTSVSYLASNILKDIVSRFQFSMPETALSAWTATEENTAGIFKTKYKLISKIGDKIEYEKTNEGFTEWDGAQKGQKINIDSKTVIVVDSSGLIDQINVSEAQVILFGSDTVSASGAKISVVLTSKGVSPDGKIDFIEKLHESSNYNRPTSLRTLLSDDQIKELSYKNTLGANNLSSLIQELKASIPDKEKTKQRLVLKFRALAYLFPQSCKELGAILTKAPLGSFEFKVISQALAATATPEATNTIAKVVWDRKEVEGVPLKLLPVCATTTAPTNEAFNIINEMAFNKSNTTAVQSAAQLALGGMVNNFRHSDPKKGESLTQYLLDKMENNNDTIQRILVLGNTGSPSILPLLKFYINDISSSKEVKSSSITALRLIDSREADTFIKEINHNNDSLIIQAIRETTTFRSKYY